MITGVNHITLSVIDLDKSFKFYTEVLSCKSVAKCKRGAYLLAGNLWLCLSLDEQTRKRHYLSTLTLRLMFQRKMTLKNAAVGSLSQVLKFRKKIQVLERRSIS